MQHPIRKLASCAVLAAAAFVGTTSMAGTQAVPIANGHLEAGPTPVAPAPSIVALTFSLREMPNGSVAGSGKMTNHTAGGWFQFELHSYLYAPDGTLFAAGTVTKQHNSSDFWNVGDTVFFGVIDNVDGSGNGLDQFLEGKVAAADGPTTIQEIVAGWDSFPPPQIFRPGISGNIHFH